MFSTESELVRGICDLRGLYSKLSDDAWSAFARGQLAVRRVLTFRYILFTITIIVLVGAIPFAVRQIYETGEIYLFSRQFLENLPKRFTGPGRLRFIIQPLVAIVWGIRAGIVDTRSGSPPFIRTLIMNREHTGRLLRHALSHLAVLGSMAILLDALSQFLIYRQIHPGAALVIGPTLIAVPYALSRALTNRCARHLQGSPD